MLNPLKGRSVTISGVKYVTGSKFPDRNTRKRPILYHKGWRILFSKDNRNLPYTAYYKNLAIKKAYNAKRANREAKRKAIEAKKKKNPKTQIVRILSIVVI